MNVFKLPNVSKNEIIIEKRISKSVLDMPVMHSHPYYELYFLLSGERKYLVDGKIYNLSQGNMILIKKNVFHQTYSLNNKGFERYVIYFYEDYINDFISDIKAENFEKFLCKTCIQFSPSEVVEFKNLFEKLETEKNKNDIFSNAEKKNIFTRIILNAMKYGEEKETDKSGGTNEIQKVMKYINENYGENITLHKAASIAFMEDTYFSKRFKYLSGIGFNEYLAETRIKAALSLLSSTDMTVSEISEACGFTSSNYFGDIFKKSLGISPTAYRKQINTKKDVNKQDVNKDEDFQRKNK